MTINEKALNQNATLNIVLMVYEMYQEDSNIKPLMVGWWRDIEMY